MNFNILIKNVLAGVIVLFSFSISAQESAAGPLDPQVVNDLNKTPKMALGLQKERHIKGAFKFFDDMLKSDLQLEKFEIVIWGDVVEQLKGDTELSRLISENQHPKLRVSICQAAMKRLGLTDADLPEGATPVPNAFQRLLHIQANGYNTVIP